MSTKPQTPYADRSDLEKIANQWRKLSGLHSREEWSAAVVRAATAAEIAANLVVRAEFAKRSPATKAKQIDGQLVKANGLTGKMERLIRPLLIDRQEDLAKVEALFAGLEGAVDKRNRIVHGGQFCNGSEATKHIVACKKFVEGLVGIYHQDFELTDPENERE